MGHYDMIEQLPPNFTTKFKSLLLPANTSLLLSIIPLLSVSFLI